MIKKLGFLISILSMLAFVPVPVFAAPQELDYMEYNSDVNAQAAYVSSPHRYWRIIQISVNDGHAPNTCEYRWMDGATARIPTTVAKGGGFMSLGQDPVSAAFDGATNTSDIGWITNNTGWVSATYDAPGYFFSSFGAYTSYDGVRGANFDLQYSDNNSDWTTAKNWNYNANAFGWWNVNLNMDITSSSESTLKTQGSYALKSTSTIITSLNKTLTRTVSPTINLSDRTTIKFDIRSSRTGSNIKIGIHDSGGTTTEITPNITPADTYQTVTWDISAVSNANKDAIDRIIVTIVNADAANTFYIDNLFAPAVIPNAPAISSVTANTFTKITWYWTDNSSGASQEDNFKIYTSTGGLLATLSADTTYYEETGLTRNKQYSRYVQAINVAGSNNSATVSWRTKPGTYQEKITTRTGPNSFGFVGDGLWEWEVSAKSGQLVTITAYIRYNASYGSATKPKLTLYNLGVNSNATMSASADTWEQLQVSGTPNRNGVLKLKIEGFSTTPGAKMYVDDISISQ
ncbi:MAG: hypothetical protein WC947_01860 [Elusimicrobiota bacterium]